MPRIPWPWLVPTLIAALGASCTHAHSGAPKAVGEDETLPTAAELGVVDPDPDDDAPASTLCNPEGKSGAALETCQQQNEASYHQFDEDAKAREPWFNFTPDATWAGSRQVEDRFVLPVVRSAEAVDKLEAKSFLELTPAEVSFYTGKQPQFAGLKAFLVRALYYDQGTGAFTVYEKDQAIFVSHQSLGEALPKENRTGLVVFLGYTPKAVYVDCEIAEATSAG